MHEMAITQEIVNVVDDARLGAGDNTHVIKVVIKIGKFTAVVPDCIKFYYDMMTENTPMHGAELEFVVVPTIVKCKSCSVDFEFEEVSFICPECGGSDTEIISGRELLVESIEVSDPAETP
jgi:hydrogenase nickel incorporation protein HypA/HybF